MSLKEKFEKRAYPAILAGLVLVAASIQINILFNQEIKILFILLEVMAIIVAIFFVDYFSKSPEFCIVSVMLLLFGAFLVWCDRDDIGELVTNERKVLIFGLLVLVGVILYISQQFFALRIIVCVGYWGSMFFLIFFNLFPVRQVMFFLAAEFVLVLVEIINRSACDKKEIQHKKMLFLSPVVLIIIVVLSLLPYSEEPFNWKAAYEWVIGMINIGDDDSDDEQLLDAGFVGYSETAGLRGDKIVVDRETLKLTMIDNTEDIYLIGNIKSDYTGDGWEESPRDTNYKGNYKEYEIDAAELLYAMYRAGVLDGNSSSEENGTGIWDLRLRELTVEYNNMSTASLFRPAKTLRINPEKHEGDILSNKEDICFSKKQDINTLYTLKYFAVNKNWEALAEFIRTQSIYVYDTMSAESYESFRKTVNLEYRTMGLPDAEDFEEELAKRAEYIREVYLDIPDSITERTYRLAEEITAGCETDYDKIGKILLYLLDFTYTMTPGNIPLGEDVVEYFLFEIQKGYCTHFASAAAILGRCVGIPTRFIQGYLLDVKNVGQYGRYTVNENQAHAWIECYFEGVGWITFDATPGSSEFEYEVPKLPEHVVDKEKPTENKYESSDGLIEKSTESYFQMITGDDTDKETDKTENKARFRGLIIAGIVLLFIMILLYLNIRKNTFWENYETASYAERLRIDLLLVIWMLKREGYIMKKDETLRMYIKRVAGFFPDKAELLLGVTELYQQVRYGKDYEISKKEQRMSERLRLSFTSEKVNMTAMTGYGRKILKG